MTQLRSALPLAQSLPFWICGFGITANVHTGHRLRSFRRRLLGSVNRDGSSRMAMTSLALVRSLPNKRLELAPPVVVELRL